MTRWQGLSGPASGIMIESISGSRNKPGTSRFMRYMHQRTLAYACLEFPRLLPALVFESGQSGPKEIAEWLERAKKRGDAGRRAELANLPSEVYNNHYPFTSKARLGRQLDACADHLLTHFSENSARARQLMAAARAPDDYRSLAPFVQRPQNVENYRMAPYSALRRLPLENGSRSMFTPDGIVPGTEGLERFLLWPIGLPPAGAMRQRGHHPVTLVGRQYFDEARLLERVFTRESNRQTI